MESQNRCIKLEHVKKNEVMHTVYVMIKLTGECSDWKEDIIPVQHE